MANLFGFEISRSKNTKEFPSFVEKTDDEGASSTIAAMGGAYGTYLDIESSTKNDAELITKYRELSRNAEIEYAIDEIINEAIDSTENDVVNLNTDNLEGYSEAIKKKIRDEFDTIKELTEINTMSYELFRNWYVDGRIYYHVVIDPANPELGIQELRYIDPRKIKKVKELTKVKTDLSANATQPSKVIKNEYYLYSEKGFGAKKPSEVQQEQTKAIKIAKDSIVSATSGLLDENNKSILSFLHKAMRPFNELRSLENSAVIYALSRAPDRRVFYIDVGNLPKAKAEQYLRDMMVKHKNRTVYDATTGEVRDDRKHMTMLEDYWFPRREGGRSTEVTSLGAGSGIAGQIENIDHFQQKLYKALNIPISRLEQGGGFGSIGRPSEISRDEIKFQKFINRLRKRFSAFMYQALEKQLILRNVIAEDEWAEIKNNVYFEFAVDNHFTEMKNLDILMARVDVADRYREYIGTAISNEFMRKKIFFQTEDEIEQIDKEIKDSSAKPTDMMPFSPGGDFGPAIDPAGDAAGSSPADEPTADAPTDPKADAKPAAKKSNSKLADKPAPKPTKK